MQEDLFGEARGEEEGSLRAPSPGPSGFIERVRLSISLDKVLFGLLASLIFFVLVFTLGVQYGKRTALESVLKEERGRSQGERPGSPAERVAREPRAPAVSFAAGGATAVLTTTRPSTREAVEVFSAEGPAVRPAADAGFPDEALPEPARRSGYTIQLVTYLARDRAEREAERLRQEGFDSFIIASGQFFQVCADSFESVQAAKGRLAQVKEDFPAYRDAYVRPVQRSA